MTVGDLLRRANSEEITDWQAYFDLLEYEKRTGQRATGYEPDGPE